MAKTTNIARTLLVIFRQTYDKKDKQGAKVTKVRE